MPRIKKATDAETAAAVRNMEIADGKKKQTPTKELPQASPAKQPKPPVKMKMEFVLTQEGLTQIQSTLNAILSDKYQKGAVIQVINDQISPRKVEE